MADKQANEGIQFSGGTMNVGAQAVGGNAHAESGDVTFTEGVTGPDLAGLLGTLFQQLDQYRDRLPGAEAATTTAEILKEELEAESPSQGSLARLLTKLRDLVRPVPELITTVGEIGTAVDNTFL